MDLFLNIIISIIEWTAFYTFPLVLLGYYFRKYVPSILLLATIMSVFSLLVRMTSLNVALIVVLQIVISLLLIKWLFKVNYLESLVMTSIGYGFFVFLQMIMVQLVVQIFEYNFNQFFFTQYLKINLQLISSIIIFILCYAAYRFKYQLNELRHHIKSPNIKNKYKRILIVNSLFMFVFIYLNISVMLIDDFSMKYTVLLLITVVLFIILFSFLMLHTKFQNKQLIDATKFYLDQEQQVAALVEKLQNNYRSHFKAISILSDKYSPTLVNEYLEKHHLCKKSAAWKQQPNLRDNLEEIDEFLYAFLINKRKLASMLGVSIIVTSNIKWEHAITLQHIRNLDTIIDDLIFTFFQDSTYVEKTIHFHIETTREDIHFDIASNFHIQKQENTELKLLDSLLQFQKNNAIIVSEFKPLHLSIRCPLV